MKMEVVGDVASLDPDLLQLSELSPLALNSNPFLAEELFSLWLSLPETSRLVKNLLNDVKTGSFSNATANSAVSTATSLPSTFPSSSTPPLSPRSTSGSPRIVKQRSSPSLLGSPLKLVSEPVREVIPQFYFKNGCPPPNELKERCLFAIDQYFYGHLGLQIHEFKAVTKDICKLPSFFSTALFRKIDVNDSGIVTRDQFVNYWIGDNLLTMDLATRVYTVLKKPHCRYLTQGDFEPILHKLLASHPGLEFLRSTPEFQERYAETVVYRIFYYINRSGTGHLTLRELKCGNLISAMQHVDEEEDINKVLRYFSYEHFYVIYCKFWELDTEHYFFIDKENLIRYGNHALTYRIVGRIFSQVPRLRGKWVMKILFTLYCQRKINHWNLVWNTGLNALIWMEMGCSHQMNCNSFTRSSYIEWNAWPKKQFSLRMYYARLLT
ncbi:hypothetical protein ERO13_D09G230400v2 [Gossypium hirsutum]|uniref:Serine/threonine protein phosphatase 2A regulatory subunit B''beta isoform X1 n=1 Tax=Gossypium hirsutum TaxID=3635 RepID=A0A1U8LRH8_GOSHI|nr:serine/threonine protein phosphatase 2A regulatory subunit B''beta-like isoform X1 [Gossypium hirsutum]KAG4131712.1 hypothetical protein ERO13_D09G230400v2 [Gossypium hirsutum]KAG4131713.1 hypothetical protein ERO13_D09G230400v2 [Gossypium hirsutum]